MKKFLITLLSFSFILISSCNSDDNNAEVIDNEDDNVEASLTATINGEPFVATNIVDVLLIRVQGIDQQRFDIVAEDDFQRLNLACTSSYTEELGMPEETYTMTNGGGEGSNALFVNSYLVNGELVTEHFGEEGIITLTEVDITNKRVSGTFSFTSLKTQVTQNEITTPDEVVVTNGVFTNLPYTIVE